MSYALHPFSQRNDTSEETQTLRSVPDPPPPPHLHPVGNASATALHRPRREAAIITPGLPVLSFRLIGKLAIFAYEAVEGTRNVGQLSNWVSADVARQLTELRALIIERRSLYHDDRRVVPTVRRVRAVLLSPGVTEAAVILNTGNRAKAIAVRLEGVRGYWQATSITVL